MVGRKKRKRKAHFIKNMLLAFVSLGFVTTGIFALWIATIKIPDFDSFNERRVAQSTKIYDRTGEVLLYDIHENTKRTIVPFNEISRFMKNATVAIEDAEFYEHKGVKPKAFLRATLVNLGTLTYSQGGSTITQQVVKNILLTPEKKISRKLKEWVLSIKLERVLSKEEILTLYLNESPYGGNIYGIEEASLAFFGKSARDLTLSESAYIASLPQAPTYYSPYGNNRDMLEKRKNLVLQRMRELGFISQDEYIAALDNKIEFLPQDPYGIKAPHFVVWVREYLVEKYGEKAVQEGGLKVITTLDYKLQQKAEEIVKKFADENEEKFNAKNAGMVGIDPQTGQILVMVGSRDYFSAENEGNFNVTLAANRQPGSAFKPFVYATAFMRGYTPETVVFDLQTQFQTTCDSEGKPLSSEVDPRDCYMPSNYDNLFRGPVMLRDALAQSINIPAIKTLYLAGLRDSLETAQKMGITSLSDPNRYGLTLVLGGGEVSLLDITSAYSVFANKGVRNAYEKILRVENKSGTVLEEFSPVPRRVIPERIALQITDILSDNVARAPAFGERSPLYFEGRDVAAKTGTTNEYRDAWIIGYTPSFALGAWAGNNDNSSMEKKVAGFVVAPMWNTFMQEILRDLPEEKFTRLKKIDEVGLKPVLRGIWQGNELYFVDSISGKLATERTPKELKEEHVLTQVHTILRWIDKKDPRGPIPEQPENDSQFDLWESSVRKWVKNRNIKEEAAGDIPKEYDDVHTEKLSPKVVVVSPATGRVFDGNSKIAVVIEGRGAFPLSRVDFFVNEVFLGTSKTPPFNFAFVPSEVGNIKETNQLKAVGYDSVLNKGSSVVIFKIKNTPF